MFFHPIAERSVVVASSIPANGDFSKALWRDLCQFCFYVWISLVLRSFAASRQDQGLPLDLDIHGRIDQREKAMSGTHSWKSWLFSVVHPPKKGVHRCPQAKVDFMEQLPIDLL